MPRRVLVFFVLPLAVAAVLVVTLGDSAGKSPRGARGRVVWQARFDRGFSGWRRLYALPGAVTLAQRIEGRAAAKFVVRPGDFPNATGERTEVDARPTTTGGFPGQTGWYHWAVLFPPNFDPSPYGWTIFTQFHRLHASAPNCRPGPNIAFRDAIPTSPLRIQLWVTGGRIVGCRGTRHIFNLGAITFNHWYDFVFHVGWSSAAQKGFVQLYLGGHQVVPLTHLATLYSGDAAFAIQGIYRAPSNVVTTVYEQPMRRGTTRASVGG